jgi:rare lipoprotein A
VPDGGEVVTTGSCGASYYWEPQPTASGEEFDPEAMTAAHKEWDFDTRVRVTNPASGDSVVVRINDRGPYIDGRCLDLARGAFREIASLDAGVITVTYEVLSD